MGTGTLQILAIPTTNDEVLEPVPILKPLLVVGLCLMVYLKKVVKLGTLFIINHAAKTNDLEWNQVHA